LQYKHIEHLRNGFDLFSGKIKEISSCKRDTQEIFESRQQALHVEIENRTEGGPFEGISSISNFLYYSPSSGEPAMLGAKKTNVDELMERNTLHQLKMYQWLLAEAYEVFEEFLVTAYAYCGLEGNGIWKRPDNWKHEGSQDIQDYDTVRKPYGQLKAFRECSQHFARYEMESPTGTNYKVVFVLIEKLRHRIVHNGGYCKDVKLLVDKMQAELKGVDMKKVRGYVESYFILHRGDKLIDLLEDPTEDDSLPSGLRTYHDPMNEFLKALVEYARLIMESAALQSREGGR
jgi:hypothetical protein